MRPELLISLSAVKTVGMPTDNRSRVIDLLKRSPRTAKGSSNGGSLPAEWTHAEAAQACCGINKRHYFALRYSYALDDAAYPMLKLWLLEWALERRELESWPQTIATVYGYQRFMQPLVECALLEEAHGGRIPVVIDLCLSPDAGLHYTTPEKIIRATIGITPRIWARSVSPIYEAIRTEYMTWISIGEGMMRRWLRDPEYLSV